jgi:hypothetical protein
MALEDFVGGLNSQTKFLSGKLDELIAGLNNQSELLNDKFGELIAGLNNQSELLNRKCEEVIEGSTNQSQAAHDGRQLLEKVIEGLNNQSVPASWASRPIVIASGNGLVTDAAPVEVLDGRAQTAAVAHTGRQWRAAAISSRCELSRLSL